MLQPPRLPIPHELADFLLDAAGEMAEHSAKAFRIATNRRRGGRTLRPGAMTPLWNELRSQLKPFVGKYGEQVNLARVLGLPRQRVHAYLVRGDQMPDAERTLQLLAWLIAARQNRRPL